MWTQDNKCVDWTEKYIKYRHYANFHNTSWDDEISDKITIFDVGYNSGDFAKLIYEKTKTIGCGISVVGFEPNINAIDLNVDYLTLVRKAVSDQPDQKVTLYVPDTKLSNENISGASSLYYRDTFKPFNVEEMKVVTTTVDQSLKEFEISHIDFLKIDTEGFEYEVLKGACNGLKDKKISCGLFEYGSTYAERSYTLNDVVSYLNGYGYECFLGPVVNGNIIPSQQAENVINDKSPDRWENIIFVNSDILELNK